MPLNSEIPLHSALLHPMLASQVLAGAFTQAGENVADLSGKEAVLLVFLRHAGCSFCRETLSDIAASKAAIEGQGIRIVLVHLGDVAELDPLLAKHGLTALDRIADSGQQLYDLFGLKRGSVRQVFGWKVIWRGLFGGVLLRHGMGPVRADAAQLPGVFLLERSEIVRRFRHRSAADRPDYAALCARG